MLGAVLPKSRSSYVVPTWWYIAQELALPDVMERYLSPAAAAAARAVETGLWSLDVATADDAAVSRVLLRRGYSLPCAVVSTRRVGGEARCCATSARSAGQVCHEAAIGGRWSQPVRPE